MKNYYLLHIVKLYAVLITKYIASYPLLAQGQMQDVSS